MPRLMYLEGNGQKIDILLDNGHVSPAVKKQGLPHIDVSKLPKKYLVGYEKPSVDTGNETIWNEMKDKLLNPYFSPIVASSLENLPPAYVFTAEHDPLRDEGILYARRLEESGVKVTHRHSDIGIHIIMGLAGMLPEADELFDRSLPEMTEMLYIHCVNAGIKFTESA
jgi:neutral cholesterol ester hydrolase 1